MTAPGRLILMSPLRLLQGDGEEDKPEGLEQLVDRLSLVQVLQPLFLPQEVGVADRLMDWIKVSEDADASAAAPVGTEHCVLAGSARENHRSPQANSR